MKTVFSALGGALGATLSCWRLILLLWLVAAFAAWAVTAPLRDEIRGVYSHNSLTPALLESFDTESYVDFLNVHGGAVDATSGTLRRLVLPWILLWTVLSAGLMARLTDPEGARGFLAACGRYAHRFVWVLGVTFVALWVLRWLNDGLSSVTTSWLVGGPSGGDTGSGVMGWTMTLKTVIALGLLGIVTTTSRVAQLRIVQLGERFVPMTWLRAFGSVLRHLPSVGLARILSYWPLFVVFWLYGLASHALLVDDGWLTWLQPWARLFLVFQLTALLVQAALVYRMAVVVRLRPIVLPAPLDAGPAVVAAAPTAVAPEAGDAPTAAVEAAPPVVATGADASEAPREETALSPDEASAWLSKDSSGSGGGTTGAAFALMVALACSTSLVAQTASGDLSTHRNAYVMDVTLDLTEHTANGRQSATFINTTSAPVSTLWMHLYANAFSNTETIWIRGGQREKSIEERGPGDGGYIDIRSVRLGGGGDLAGQAAIEDTLLRIDLPAPVVPGGSVTLDIEFVTRFPRTIARMGMTGPHLDGMQWFPKFCAHDESGWHAEPFHNRGEFFADFGSYDVTFHYPSQLDGRTVELEATGVPVEESTDVAGTATRRYQASDVHDFAFVADPNAIRFTEEWQDPGSARTVQIVYLCQPYAEPKARQVLDAMHSYLTSSAAWWIPYPYPRVVLDGLPPNRGGGMEYPMLFTISQRFPSHMGWFNELTVEPASVTAHEYAHQYFYGIVASDEVDEAFLDEGFTTWATNQLFEAYEPGLGTTDAFTFLERALAVDVFNGALTGDVPGKGNALSLQEFVGWNTSPFHSAPPARPGRERLLLGYPVPPLDKLRLSDMTADKPAWWKRRYYRDATARPLTAPSRDFSRGYGSLIYNKTALVLQTLENLMGDDEMRRLMRTYVERHAFDHPTKDDFLALASEMTGGAYDALLVQLVETNGTLDFAVEEVTSVRREALVGYGPQTRPGELIDWHGAEEESPPDRAPWWERAWSSVFTLPFPGGTSSGAEAPAAAGAPAEEGGAPQQETTEGPWRSRFVVRQLGTIETPVYVEATFEDGSMERLSWDGAGGFRIFELENASKLASVVVDPDRDYLVDLDRNNNGRRIQAADEEVRALGFFTHFWAENTLAAWSLLF